MNFNTAILYDIENLIGGYARTDLLSALSLKDIYNAIAEKQTGGKAIQRAYANWSDPRLNILRGDIIELGIEPVQMFGFGRGAQKDVSDIQLAIDAVEIAFTKPAIEVFVIVSGDGGFSSLAKKLHEYGKMVVGCGYKRATNKVFAAVCDEFFWIEEPTKDENELPYARSKHENMDPVLAAFSKKYQPFETTNRDQIFNSAREILTFFEKNKDTETMLKHGGLNISIFSEALDYRLGGFNYLQCGFLKLVDFIRYVTNGTRCKLVLKPPSDYRLVLKNSTVNGFEDVEPLKDIEELHTFENYKKILAKGGPVFRIPDKDVVYSISDYLCRNKTEFQGVYIGDIIDKLGGEFNYDQNDIKGCVFSLVSADSFLKEPEDKQLSEQKLSFIYQSVEPVIENLRSKMRSKLQTLLGSVKDEEFSKIC